MGNRTLELDAQTGDGGKVEGSLPSLTGIVSTEAVERFRPDLFGCRSLDHLAIPSVVTLAATIDEPNVDATLLGVHAKLFARDEGSFFFAADATTEDTR